MMNVLPLVELGSSPGFISDSHGDARYVIEAIYRLYEEGATSYVQLGDFLPTPWRGTAAQRQGIAAISTALRRVNGELWTLQGNHAPRNYTNQLAVDEDGYRWLTDRMWILPMSGRMTADGRDVGFLDGAASVDRSARTPGWDWFAAELPSDADAAALFAGRPVDILFAHEAPTTPALDRHRQRIGPPKDPRDRPYVQRARDIFDRCVADVIRTDGYGIAISGHHHARLSGTARLERSDGEPVALTSEVLAKAWYGPSIGMLDTTTLRLRSWQLDERQPHWRSVQFENHVRALGYPPRFIAAELGVSYREFLDLRSPRTVIPPWLFRRLESFRMASCGGGEISQSHVLAA